MSDRAIEENVRTAVRESFERETIPLLVRLVEQPSCTREPADVEACAALTDAEAARIGLSIEVRPDPAQKVASHRVYTTPATGPGDRAVALVGHLDTVFPRSMGFFGFRRDGDVARGPGVLDMKSGVVSTFAALDAIRRAAPDRHAALRARIVLVSDEEIGSPSSRALYAELAPRTTEALVFEAGRTGDLLVTRRRGGGLWTITAHGRAAHAGNRHRDGVNAIHALALLVPRIEGITDYARGLTVNVGLFEGGTAKNTVPERAELGIDGRFESAADAAELETRLRALVDAPFVDLDGVPERLASVRFELGGGVTRPPMEATAATQALRVRYEACAAECGLGVGEAPLQGGGSDANLLAAAGVPCIDGLGPAGRDFHETTEHADLASLLRRTEALALFLLRHAW